MCFPFKNYFFVVTSSVLVYGQEVRFAFVSNGFSGIFFFNRITSFSRIGSRRLLSFNLHVHTALLNFVLIVLRLMASDNQDDSLRMAALCKRLGRLGPTLEVEILEEEPQPLPLEECRLLLVGKVLSNSAINFPAFQSTLKRIWRTTQVEISQQEEGLSISMTLPIVPSGFKSSASL